ncbi:unnamed protein product [Candida verbasci]|uniref:Protein kinase domain-containing protein n=1 Tax=Candida verbasci TaxID=1227364 RepID=A0A9W4XC10_9ASCO|nr:unnamed protein product [Candida verbasci]
MKLSPPNLTIDIPIKDNETPPKSLETPLQHKSIKSLNSILGPPLNIETSTNTTSNSTFEKITQLPTPILSNGSFSNISSQPILSSPPREYKINNNSSPRVISDYKPPIRHNSLKLKSRIVSNPLVSTQQSRTKNDSSSSSIESPLTPSTSPILISKNFTTEIFYSSKLNCSFHFVKQLGMGNFSTVILARENTSGLEIAIKVISIPTESKNQIYNFKSFIRRELNILKFLNNHPCVSRLIDYSITLKISKEEIENDLIEEDSPNVDDIMDMDNNEQLIFMNCCQGGNLLNFLLENNQSKNNLIYWIYAKRIICEILITIAYLHKHNIIHRDIKLENILLLYNLNQIETIFGNNQSMETAFINISDFGLSKRLKAPDQLLSTRCGSQDYIAPEILMGLQYNGKLTDAWSVGVLIYSILENKLPFDNQPQSNTNSSYHDQNRISPSVLKRRRSKKNSPAHRIAMIDWEWIKINEDYIDNEPNVMIKQIIKDLKKLVELLLVKKSERLTLEQLIQKFDWISATVPEFIRTK